MEMSFIPQVFLQEGVGCSAPSEMMWVDATLCLNEFAYNTVDYYKYKSVWLYFVVMYLAFTHFGLS